MGSFGGGFASGLAAGTASANRWVDLYEREKMRRDLAEANQMSGVTEQASGETAIAEMEKNWVPQEGGPATAQEYLMQNPEALAAIDKQKAGYLSEGKEFGTRAEALDQSKASRDARVASVLRERDPAAAAKYEHDMLQGRSAALQVDKQERGVKADELYAQLSSQVEAGEITQLDAYKKMKSSGFLDRKQIDEYDKQIESFKKEGGFKVFASANSFANGKMSAEAALAKINKDFNETGELRGFTAVGIDKNMNITFTNAKGEQAVINAEAEANKYASTKELADIGYVKANTKLAVARADAIPEETASRAEVRRTAIAQREDMMDQREQDRMMRESFKHFMPPSEQAKLRESEIAKVEGDANRTPEDKAAAVASINKRFEVERVNTNRGFALIEAGIKPSDARAAVDELSANRVFKDKATGQRFVKVGSKKVSVEDLLPPAPKPKEDQPQALNPPKPGGSPTKTEQVGDMISRRANELGLPQKIGSDWKYRPR